MTAKICLTVTEGPLMGKEFVFRHPIICTVGRSSECFLRLPGGDANLTASRRHCLLDIDPPHVLICDLGSRNGTIVNGHNIGNRPESDHLNQPASGSTPEVVLQDGDKIQLGSTVFQVAIDTEESGVFGRETASRALEQQGCEIGA